MVYIKRIDIKGFKTFRRKASINLEHGLTVITGPNGSGKSNIMDAVKFALGELSPKELRGGTFDDLISKASPSETARSAYVAIQFENKDRRIPIDADYVTVSREFMKGGEGIYRVNGKRISRRRINDALLSAGLTLSGLNVVPQHTITRLADTTPEERRRIIEDMVGIGVYDSKKEEALTQLQQADINVKIASARVEEVTHRVKSLEEERNKLLRSRFINSEVKNLSAQTISAKINQLEKESTELSKYYDKLSDRLSELKIQRKTLHSERETLENEKNNLETKILETESSNLLDLDNEISRLSVEKAELTAELEANRRNIHYMEKQSASIKNAISTSEKKVSETRGRMNTLERRREALSDEIRALESERSKLTIEISGLRDRHSKSFSNADSVNKRIYEIMKVLSNEDSNLKSTSHKLQILSDELVNQTDNRRDLTSTLDKISSRISELRSSVKVKRSKINETFKAVSELEQLKGRREYYIDRALKVAERAEKILANLKSSQKREYDGTNRILEYAAEGLIKGNVRWLRDLISISEPYRSALEAASDGWIDSIVVDDFDSALNCLKVARLRGLGPIRVIPLAKISKSASLTLPLGCKAVRAVDLVDVPSDIKPAVVHILGDTAVTESRREAFLLSLEGVRAVSKHGDLFEPYGGIMIGDYRSISEWPQDATIIKRLLKKLEKSLEKGREDLNKIRNELERLKLDAAKLDGDMSIQKGELRTYEGEYGRIKEEISGLDESIRESTQLKDGFEETATKLASRVESLRDELDKLNSKRSSLMAKIQESPVREAEAEASKIESRLEELRREQVKVESELTGLRSSEEVLSKNIERLFEQRGEVENRIKEQRSSVDEMDKAGKIRSEELEDLMERRKRVASSLFKLREDLKGIDNKLKSVNEEMGGIYEEAEATSSKYEELSSSIKNTEVEKAVLTRDLRSLGYETPPPLEGYSEKYTAQLRSTLEDELRAISAINELALEQYSEYTSNYKGLSMRINELDRERLTIVRFMDELDGRKREAFMQAFRKVDSAFKDIFFRLAGGGSGRLVLEDPENPFKGGLEILLAFPSKAEFSISGASGGEKSLSTVCFTLALQEINPMPFYMFDEIDAHLDVWNSQRLADLMKERSKGSQFIIISLKDSTVAKADRVYGVYIESGFSMIVALPRGELAA